MSGRRSASGGSAQATLSDIAFTITPPITLMPTSGGSARLTGALVSANTFAHARRQRPARPHARRQRTKPPARTSSSSAPAAWQRYFQGDPGILGRTITLKTLGPEAGFLDGTPLTIVGVMPASFDFPFPNCDYWAPITEGSPARTKWADGVIARLRDGVSIQAATDEANAIGEGLRPKPTSGPLSRPLPPGERRFVVEGVKEQIVAPSRPALRVIADRGRRGAADRVRERRQPAAGAGHGATA